MKVPRRFLRLGLLAGALAACLLAPAQASQSHALILWIGDYGDVDLNLPGIDKDAALARGIARQLGVPETNIREVSNAALTRQGVTQALQELERRLSPGDQVFLYFSGHGFQGAGSGGAACSEALVTRDSGYYTDGELHASLTRLGSKARQVVMMNDSCFAGGAATTKGPQRSRGPVVKSFPAASIKGDVGQGEIYQCGDPVNKFRNFEPERIANRPNMVYLAAASAREVAFASPIGSAATVAWHACLSARDADADRSGTISASELQACAQRHVNQAGYRQTLTTVGAADLPMSFQGAGIGAAGDGQVAPVAALRDIARLANRNHRVDLRPRQTTFRINADLLEFTVSTDRPGYLYVFQAGSDGRTFNVLFPNDIDGDHFLTAGSHVLPRPGGPLRLRSRGPAGSSHVLAVVVDKPVDLSRFGLKSNGFRAATADTSSLRNFVAESARAGEDAYGASSIVELREQP